MDSILIDKTVGAENPIQEKVEQASKYPSDDPKNNNCNDILGTVSRYRCAKIKHNQPSLTKETTFSTTAEPDQAPQYNSNNSSCKECSPQESTSPPEKWRREPFSHGQKLDKKMQQNNVHITHLLQLQSDSSILKQFSSQCTNPM
jgi:hypothetical protein